MPHPDDTAPQVTPQSFATWLQDLMSSDDPGLRAKSYEEAGMAIIEHNRAGLVVTLEDGEEFQINIVQTKGPRR